MNNLRSLSLLTINMKHALKGKTITGFNVPDFMARLEDRQTELAELEEVAGKADMSRAIVQVLDDLLGRKELEEITSEAHRVILTKKHDMEGAVQAKEKQLTRCSELASTLIADALMIQGAVEAQERGCLNSKLVGMHVRNQARAELQPDGTLKFSFMHHNGSDLLNKHGDPATIGDVIDTFADESPQFFKEGDGSPQKPNPWMDNQLNLTKQGQILRENPTLARQLAAEAGVNLNV